MIVMVVMSYMSFQEYSLLAVRAPVKSDLTANCTTFIVFELRKVIAFCYEDHPQIDAMNAKSEEGGTDGGCSIWSCILSKDEDDDDDEI